jgi:hypothetical protein
MDVGADDKGLDHGAGFAVATGFIEASGDPDGLPSIRTDDAVGLRWRTGALSMSREIAQCPQRCGCGR